MSIPFLPLLGPTVFFPCCLFCLTTLRSLYCEYLPRRGGGGFPFEPMYRLHSLINNIKCISVGDLKDIPTRARARPRASHSFGLQAPKEMGKDIRGFVLSCRASDTPGCLLLDGRSGALTAFVLERRG
ncbi:hypothetical protein BDZ85DRAFT_5792 [Elsinoe ampelina]|uniref:Uncharacterized protein n=1 Tax=Elsinoe ampelina TaxID=302913 RepID=A0A6A6GPG9_9PEZI|nr:hypothetical protein BDZ85DRAFT_5792 [Elsinoe ampelina]